MSGVGLPWLVEADMEPNPKVVSFSSHMDPFPIAGAPLSFCDHVTMYVYNILSYFIGTH